MKTTPTTGGEREPDSVREAFERWFRDGNGDASWLIRSKRHPSQYDDNTTDGMWDGWQAAHAAAQSRIASLEAERDEWKSIAEHNLSRRLSALEERNAAVTARDEALARVASLEQAMREVLEFQSAPEGPHISEWGRWRRLIDGSKWVERAGLSTTSTANQAACRQQNAIHEPQAGLSLTGEPAGAEGQTP